MKGFTLIETLVAVSIISIAVSAPLYSASRSIVAAQTSNYQLTALYLAQEGVEYVRMMRDNEYLAAYRAGGSSVSSTAWTNFKTANPAIDYSSIRDCISPNICTLDVTTAPGLSRCVGGVCTPLYIISSSGLYTQTGGVGKVLQPYTRTVQAFDLTPTDLKVVSTVAWSFHGVPFSVSVTDHLTPWQ